MKTFTDWQQRVIVEQQGLASNISKLGLYVAATEDADPLLKIQLAAMKTYNEVLVLRIEKFTLQEEGG